MKRQSPSSCPSWNFEIDDEHGPVAKRPRCFVSSPTRSLDESNEINEDDTNNEAEESIITTATINEESQIGISIDSHTVLDDDNDDDEIIEIEREDLANGIVIVSDSELEDNDDDQEIDVTDEIPPSVSSIFSPENDDIEVVAEVIQDEQVIVDEEIDTTTDYDDDDDDNESLEIIIDNINSELIDLTDDEPNPNSYSPDSVERKLSTDVQQCPICLETLSDLQQTGVYLIITRCHHVMCTLCCRQLLATSSRCPLCRENVSVTSLMPYCILT